MAGLVVMRSELLDGYGIVHGFSTRSGGVSEPPFAQLNLGRGLGDADDAVEENHRRLAREVGYEVPQLFEVSQVHGVDVLVVEGGESPEAARARQADAIVALPQSRAAVGVRTADCVPVLLAHPESGTVAAVHVGWRGAVGGVLLRAVAVLRERSGARDAAGLVAALGPHIRRDAYEVGEDVAARIAEAAPGAIVVRRGDRRPHADLAGLCRAQLRAVGVPHDAVDDVGGCTFSEPDRFYSHRRDGAESGRHLAVIVAGPPLPDAA